jgi:serine/threonine-protein kinase RsbW
MLDLVQALSDHMGQVGKLDEDSAHWVGVAVRESVINAIKHGNKEDDKKRVSVEFRFEPIEEPTQFVVRILDQGEGFNPVEVADPLEPRGIFFMRSFMDDVTLRTAPEGGTEVRMVKKLG